MERFLNGCRFGRGAIANVDVGRQVQGCADSKERIEAQIARPVFDPAGVVDIPTAFETTGKVAFVIGCAAIFQRPIPAEMPLSNAGRRISVLLARLEV